MRMVCHCCICKLTKGEIKNISFHSIPKDEDQKVKWLTFIGREVSKSASVCSRHFEESDFNYKVYGNGLKRFLKAGIVPSIFFTRNYKYKEIEEQESRVITKSPTSEQFNEPKPFLPMNEIEALHNEKNQISEPCILHEPNNETESFLNFLPIKVNVDSKSESSLHFLSVKDLDDLTHKDKLSLKRKIKEPLTGPKKYKIPRFIGDLRRDDFTSDASFKIVQNYFKKTKLKTKLMNHKIKRLTEKASNYTDL